jgi:glycosyltransferase involved in cell wall biosynthesis
MAVHLINPMEDYTGAELHTANLYRILSEHTDVTIWSTLEPHPRLAELVPIRRIEAWRGRMPIGGTIVFVGFYYYVGQWAAFTPNRRRILVCNTDHVPSFRHFYRRISLYGRRTVELVHVSESIKQMVGLPGWICPSPIDLELYSVVSAPRDAAFTVGRHSRDTLQKHHDNEPAFYSRLLAAGCKVRVMGGTLLRDRMAPCPGNLELLPFGAEASSSFLQQLDCFYYRTNSSFFEAYGRVVFEAMACGLPVVVHRSGGYAEFLTHGEDAFIFDTDDEAFAIIMRLRADPGLRARIGANARKRVIQIYSDRQLSELKQYYLS